MSKNSQFDDLLVVDVDKNLSNKRKRRQIDASLRDVIDLYEDGDELDDLYDAWDLDVFEPIPSKRGRRR